MKLRGPHFRSSRLDVVNGDRIARLFGDQIASWAETRLVPSLTRLLVPAQVGRQTRETGVF